MQKKSALQPPAILETRKRTILQQMSLGNLSRTFFIQVLEHVDYLEKLYQERTATAGDENALRAHPKPLPASYETLETGCPWQLENGIFT